VAQAFCFGTPGLVLEACGPHFVVLGVVHGDALDLCLARASGLVRMRLA